MMIEAYAPMVPLKSDCPVTLDTPTGRIPLTITEAKMLLADLQAAVRKLEEQK
jgi:hypothetical protein